MAFLEPKLLHAMLKSLADSIGDYANYQVIALLCLLQMLRVSSSLTSSYHKTTGTLCRFVVHLQLSSNFGFVCNAC